MPKTVLDIKDLSITFQTDESTVEAVKKISFDVTESEVCAIVGESGSGKSVTAQSILGLVGRNHNEIVSGCIELIDSENSIDLLKLEEKEIQKVRGRKISMIFQEPMTSLHPMYRVGDQLGEAIKVHSKLSKDESERLIIEVLDQVMIPRPKEIINDYPHSLSGGMRQRVMIAMAILFRPRVLIADEPTTALDVTIQNEILSLILKLIDEIKLSVIFITHDMSVVSEIADQVLVMKNGYLVEKNTVTEIFTKPEKEYTKNLIKAVPIFGKNLRNEKLGKNLKDKTPLLEVKGVTKTFIKKYGFFKKNITMNKAVDNVSLNLKSGETLSIVGESGSGKTTLARCITHLIDYEKGKIVFNGENLKNKTKNELNAIRREIQFIFQDPYASLNPRMPVNYLVTEPLFIHNEIEKKINLKNALDLLNEVKLNETFLNRYPHELSGGQRQRICIARALALKPKLIVADEPLSALDVTIQAQIIDLLIELQLKYNLSYLFISHDLAVVEKISHYVGVMFKGNLVEYGKTNEVLYDPKHSYTKMLLASIPTIEKDRQGKRIRKQYSTKEDFGKMLEFSKNDQYIRVTDNHFYLN